LAASPQRNRTDETREVRSLEHLQTAPVTASSALQAGLWDRDYGDLVDLTLTAIALETGIPLIHTDRVLKRSSGCPQRSFRGKAEACP
jgi:predicted nucleic acid-binding protein